MSTNKNSVVGGFARAVFIVLCLGVILFIDWLAGASLTPVQDADQDPPLGLDVEFFALRFSQLQSAVGWRL